MVPKRTKVILEKEDGQWRLIINLGPLKRAAIKQARTLVAKLAPAELMPRNLDGTFATDARETYGSDPRKSRG